MFADEHTTLAWKDKEKDLRQSAPTSKLKRDLFTRPRDVDRTVNNVLYKVNADVLSNSAKCVKDQKGFLKTIHHLLCLPSFIELLANQYIGTNNDRYLICCYG